MSIIGTFRVGEDILVALDALSGDPGTVSAPAAWLASTVQRGGGFAVPEDAAHVALAVTARAAAGDIPAGWNLLLAAASSAALVPGVYGIDLKMTDGATVNITDATAFVRLTRSAVSP